VHFHRIHRAMLNRPADLHTMCSISGICGMKLCVLADYVKDLKFEYLANLKQKLKIFYAVNQDLKWILLAEPIETKNLLHV
jgi:hypothetical protein